MRRLLAVLLSGVVFTGLVTGLGAAPAPADSPTWPTLGEPPLGANDWSCQPTADRPSPVIIVHGTFGDQKSLLDTLSFTLVQDGYCVFALDYGDRATGPIEESAAQLGDFVDRVLAETGAAKVHLVGHSQGGMMPRYYIKNLGGEPFVEDLVGLAPSNHGTEVSSGEGWAGWGTEEWCTACEQQAAGSDFLTELNSPDETPGAVDYTQVVTVHDEVVVPYTSGFLTEDAQSVNVTLQDRCPGEPTEHLTIPTSPQAIAWVLDAFGRPGPADPGAAIGCAG